MEYGEYGHGITSVGLVVTKEWTGRFEGCHDGLISYTEDAAVCVGDVQNGLIYVVTGSAPSAVNEEQVLELHLKDVNDWDAVWTVNGEIGRVCADLSTDR